MDYRALSEAVALEFSQCRGLLSAIGDETRQVLIVALMSNNSEGLRAVELAEQTHLSRPAVSHHLKILLEAGMLAVVTDGTKRYYRLRRGEAWQSLVALVADIERFPAG